jgi:hypothetical protein
MSSAVLMRGLRFFVASVVLLLLTTGSGKLFALQDPDNGQYSPRPQAPDQQPGSAQPGYGKPSPYPQQPDAQQAYPQENYPQKDYPQQTYPEQSSPQQTYPAPGPSPTYPQQGYAAVQPLGAQQLEQLVAPIALYPDTLVAQVLAASTYPAQVADADRWRRAQGFADSYQIAAGADAQAWDPSVKALTAFPQVLAEMSRNLQWTTELGNAYYNQPQDMLSAVQVMRRRAEAAGNLQSTPQEVVSNEQGNIVVAPANPQVIYVPVYTPWVVYGQPVAPYPGFSLLEALGSFLGSSFGSGFGSRFGPSAVNFGLGIAMAAFTHMPWGWLGWGLNWLAQSVLFHQSNYYSQSTTVADWGFPHGGARAFSGRGSTGTFPNRSWAADGYGRSSGGYYGARVPGVVRTPGRSSYAANRLAQGFGRSYQAPGNGYGRPVQQAYNRVQMPAVRTQQYGRSSYGSSSYSRSTESYGGRPGSGYGNSTRAYRPQGASFAKAPKSAHSGGFHFFGGGHASKGYKADKGFGGGKSFKAGKSFGGGHSGGGGHFGGHSGGHSGGKHHH